MSGVLLAALLAAVAFGGELRVPRAAPPAEVATHDFSAPVAKGWAAVEEGGRAVLTGRERDGALSRITLEFRAAPEGGADAYLRRLRGTRTVPLKGETTGAVEAADLGGRAAKRVARVVVLMLPPNSAAARAVALKEEHVVLPAKGGFFLAVYSVPAALDRESRPAFARVLSGFKPKR